MKKIVSVCGVLALSLLGGQEANADLAKPWEHKEAPWEREEQQNSPELSSQDEGTPASDHAFEGQGEPE